MRISGIQNFITNSIGKVNQNSNNSVNNSTKNNLERSPMQDTVSFGKFGGRYAKLTEDYVFDKLIDGNIDAYDVLDNATYLSIEPTEDTIKDPSKHIYKAKLISCRVFRPDFSQEKVNDYDNTMKQHIKRFNKTNNYASDWVNHLTTTEDFEKAARLADYLEDRGYIPKGSGDEDAWMKDRPYTLFY